MCDFQMASGILSARQDHSFPEALFGVRRELHDETSACAVTSHHENVVAASCGSEAMSEACFSRFLSSRLLAPFSETFSTLYSCLLAFVQLLLVKNNSH